MSYRILRMKGCIGWALLGLVVTLALPDRAFAQEAAEPAPSASESASPKMEEAKERFARGLKLYQEANYEAARVEFERAYALAPSWKLLYNVGYCYRQLNDYVAAIRALEKFLEEGREEIAAERRGEVTTTLADLRTRVASLEIVTNVAGATVAIDDVPVGQSPLQEPVTVNPGRRRVTAVVKGGQPVTQIVTVAGRESARVVLELAEQRPVAVEKKTNVAPYVAWGVTGLLVAGTAVTGVLALNAKSSQNDRLNELSNDPSGERQALNDAQDKTRTLSVVTDVLLVSSILAGGVAAYFTIKALGRETPKERRVNALNAGVGPSSFLFSGRF
jgi:hypothetical protein